MKQKCPICNNFACTCAKEKKTASEKKTALLKPNSDEKTKAMQEYAKLEKEYHIHMGMGYDHLRQIRVQLDNLETFLKNA